MVRTESSRGVAKSKSPSLARASGASKVKTVPFDYYAPEANTVAVAGDFNGWDIQAHMLKQSKAGWWKTNIRLPPGQYQYRFVIDGDQWNEDPENPEKTSNQFNSYNSVVKVR